ncbi:MAG: prolyl oligopeptidase family serine peptidase [Pseudomonadota bacterium]
MTDIDPRPTADAPDDDPYLWLEEIDSPRALEWVSAQNAATLRQLNNKEAVADRALLKAIFDRADNIPFPNRRGGKLFNPWTDAAHPRGVWRTTTLESFCRDTPQWDVLIDLDKLASEENEDWFWRGADTLLPDHDRAIVRLSRGGSDAATFREFDVVRRRFVPDGFVLPESISATAWLDRDTLLLCSPLGQCMATRSGFARTVRLWRRGENPLTAPVLFEASEGAAEVGVSVHQCASGERILFAEKLSLFSRNLWIGDRSGPKLRLNTPADSEVEIQRDWLAIKLRTSWTIGNETFAPGTVVGTNLSAFLAGQPRFARLFEPDGRRALQQFFWCGDRLVLSLLDDLKPVFETIVPAGGTWSRETISGLSEFGSARVWPFDLYAEESRGDLLASSYDRLNPPTLFLVKPNLAPQILKRAPQAFDAAGHRITRHEAISIDGVRIPYVQVGPDDETGEAPVHMYGYGGFGISQPSYYNTAIGKLWLERGGTSVITHLRGGREFGEAWYEAGRREGRRLVHDDFAAVAADLVRRGVTRPGRIAAEGGSNGGLLIANMLTRYPGRFGALFCTVPIIDMRRYTKLFGGAALIGEYGDPDNPEDWAFLKAISAYHVAAPSQTYPPIFIATSRKDDRMHPGHARKMAAKLQAMGYEAHFLEFAGGGHGYGKDNDDKAMLLSLGYSFLRRAIGWSSY